MITKQLEFNDGIKIRLDLDTDNRIAFFDFTLPRRELDDDEFKQINKVIDNLKQ